ncbi:MAG: AAA family ATPase [Deltaproteobacteria bacterium]|nr:AAA family ATPase [Deltaproteobacteria bacterium]
MYLPFFHFKEEPFNLTPDPGFLFLSQQHEEAIESLLYGVRYRKGFMALMGEIGTGKTTLCRTLLDRLGEEVDTAVILNPMLSTLELLQTLNDDFGNSASYPTVKGQIDALNRFLMERCQRGRNAVVLIDEAQDLSMEALEMIRLLSNLETEEKKLLQIILSGQLELEQKLHSRALKQLNQRIGIRYFLTGLNREETEGYIVHRICVAGGEGGVQFQEKAIDRIYRVSGGIPRLINVICDRALLAAYAERARLVTVRMIGEAVADVEGTTREPVHKIYGKTLRGEKDFHVDYFKGP